MILHLLDCQVLQLYLIDNIIICGRDENEVVQWMEKTSHLCKKNLTIIPKNCEFLKDEITCMCHKLSANAISPDKIKIHTTALYSQNIKN